MLLIVVDLLYEHQSGGIVAPACGVYWIIPFEAMKLLTGWYCRKGVCSFTHLLMDGHLPPLRINSL